MWLPSKGGRPRWRGPPAPQQRWSHPGRGVRGTLPQGWPGTRGDYIIGLESLRLRSRGLGCSDRACTKLRTLTYISFSYFTNKWTSFYILFDISSSQLSVWSVMFMIIAFKWWIISEDMINLFFTMGTHILKQISVYINLSHSTARHYSVLNSIHLSNRLWSDFLYHPQINTEVTTWSLACVHRQRFFTDTSWVHLSKCFFHQLLRGVTISNGGVLPRIHPELLSKKRGGRVKVDSQASVTDKQEERLKSKKPTKTFKKVKGKRGRKPKVSVPSKAISADDDDVHRGWVSNPSSVSSRARVFSTFVLSRRFDTNVCVWFVQSKKRQTRAGLMLLH